jgi:hypothetical protein
MQLAHTLGAPEYAYRDGVVIDERLDVESLATTPASSFWSRTTQPPRSARQARVLAVAPRDRPLAASIASTVGRTPGIAQRSYRMVS